MGGAHTDSYVTVLEDGSDRYLPENVRHKYLKAPAWMFHGSIVDGRKGLSKFWEKGWGTINSTKYDEYILTHIAQIFHDHVLDGIYVRVLSSLEFSPDNISSGKTTHQATDRLRRS